MASDAHPTYWPMSDIPSETTGATNEVEKRVGNDVEEEEQPSGPFPQELLELVNPNKDNAPQPFLHQHFENEDGPAVPCEHKRKLSGIGPKERENRVWKRPRCDLIETAIEGENVVNCSSPAMITETTAQIISCTQSALMNLPQFNLIALPIEVLFEIFSWVPAVDLWRSARGVCSSWRALAGDTQLWRAVCGRAFQISWTEEQLRCCNQYDWRQHYKQLAQNKADLDVSIFTGDVRDKGQDRNPLGCAHYRRNIKMFAECCRRFFVCRHCHNENQDHEMNRYDVKTMYCMRCRTIQPMRGKCNSVICQGKPLAQYFCGQCNFHDDAPGKDIYHCPHCNVCYRGKGLGFDYYHCQDCDLCFLLDFRATHQHIFRRKLEEDRTHANDEQD